MKKTFVGTENIQEKKAAYMLQNFDFRQVTTIFSV